MSNSGLWLYCFDPGATTGIAVLQLKSMPSDERFPYELESFKVTQVENILKDLPSINKVQELLLMSTTTGESRVIIEKVRTAHPSIDQTGVSVMGGLQALVLTRPIGTDLAHPIPVLQAPQNKEAAKKWPIGASILGCLKYQTSEHQRDALLHGIYYLVTQKLVNPALKLSAIKNTELGVWDVTQRDIELGI